jgi:Holliday junction DNA helicase RuvB
MDILSAYKMIDRELEIAKNNPIHSENPLEIVIKPEILDTSALEEGESNYLYRPTSFDEYIGQDKAKKHIQCYLDGCKKFNEKFPNTFLTSPAGCGKTLLANILANKLGKNFITLTAGEIKSEQQLVDKIVACQSGILFLDEAHRISNKIGTFLLPILEEYKVCGKKIKPFIMIFATTHKGNLSENLSALLQRFPLMIELEQYTNENIIQILQQFKHKSYKDITINDNIYLNISQNCKSTPRIAINLLREFIFIEDWNLVKSQNKIVKDGFAELDIRALNFILNSNGASKLSVAKFLRVEPKTFEFEIEPYLINQEMITVSNKRKITIKGKEFINAIQKRPKEQN